jgi:hypothetical protein
MAAPVRRRTKLFVSFDFDNDKKLYDFIIGQAKLPDAPFQVSDVSLKEAAPERNWEIKARAAITRADKFLVMLGPKTCFAPGVKKEIAIARALGKPRYQVIGYRNGSSAWAVPNAGRCYAWKWDNIKKILG